jgi:predicted permease
MSSEKTQTVAGRGSTGGSWRGWTWLETVGLDLGYAWRSLRKTPGTSAVAVVSLALGIGAATTVLCWLKNVVWQPLPGVADQGRVVVIVGSQGGGGVSLPDLRDIGALQQVFVGAAASQLTPASVSADGRTEWAYAQVATANYFALLGVRPILGRTFLPDEDSKPSGNPVLVISESYWRRRFAADPSIVGRVVEVNRHPFTIVGVVPAAFRGTMIGLAFDFWAPVSMLNEVGNWSHDFLTARNARGLHDVARLRPGVTLAQAGAAVRTLDTQLELAYPRTNQDVRYRVVAQADCPYGAQAVMGSTLRLLLAVTLGVLLIVAANVANLLLGRAVSRQKEIAIRLAAGASRPRLVRQLATESLMLAALGGSLGVVLAAWMVSMLRSFLPASGIVPNLAISYGLDARTLGYALLVTLATALAFGLVPALQASRPSLYETLKEGGRSSGAGAAHHRLRHGLVIVEVALALVLLVGAGLCLKGLQQARRIDFGFDPRGVLIAELQVGMNGYDEAGAKTLYARIQRRLAELPGVQEAALASWFPLGLAGCKGSDASVEGYQRPPGEDTTYEYARVSPRYFATMGIPLVAGRDFGGQDDAGATPVAIVNEHFAARFWPGQDAVGRRFRSQGAWRTVVGVAKAGKYNRLDEGAWPFFYLPYQQGVPERDLSVAVRTSGDPASLARALQAAVHELDPRVDVLQTKTLRGHTDAVFFAQRLASILLALLGALGVFLAAIGVYAVMAYAVGRRTQEFGVRLALGASQPDLVRLVVRQGLVLAALGVTIGLAVSVAVTRLLAGFLFGVSPFDPLTFLGVPAFLALVTVLACWLPARRAARVDPLVALRCE